MVYDSQDEIWDAGYETSNVEWEEKLEKLKKKRMKFICKNGVKHTDTPVVFWSDVEKAFA